MNRTPLDVLAIAAHPDDVELSVGGTMCLLARQGYRTGIVDLTRGELGTRGTPEMRAEEAAEASRIMQIQTRSNLGMPDGNIENTLENRLKLIREIRLHRPQIILMNPLVCRHPDHGAAARLTIDCLFYAGLKKMETQDEAGRLLEPWRPSHALHYVQSAEFEPSLIVDVSEVWQERMETLWAFKSQFHNPNNPSSAQGPQTFISNPGFLDWIESRAKAYGYRIGAKYGEPLLYHQGPFGVQDLVKTFSIAPRFK